MYCVVFITAKDSQEAKMLADALLQAKLVACANVVSGVESFFWWEGKIDSASEALLILKTKQERFDEIVKTVKSLHSYECPEIIAMPIEKGYDNYLKWISESVK